jgi:CNT family concentrative nucleoside transporter
VVHLVNAAMEAPLFLFGVLSQDPGSEGSVGLILAFQVLPAIVVFSVLIALTYHFGVMQKILLVFSLLFNRLMKLSGAESLCAASNFFVGIESALMIRPHLRKMTSSELCTVLTVGMATVASNVMTSYVIILRDAFPNIAGHLVSASFILIPAALIMSKLIMPETLGRIVEPAIDKKDSVFDVIIDGSGSGIKMIFGIAALLISIVGIVAILNTLLGLIHPAISLENILAYLFYPFALLMGVPAKLSRWQTCSAYESSLRNLIPIRHSRKCCPAGQSLRGRRPSPPMPSAASPTCRLWRSLSEESGPSYPTVEMTSTLSHGALWSQRPWLA